MDQVVTRLKEEKVKCEKELIKQGRLDGKAWAKKASFRELVYVVDGICSSKGFTEFGEILGDYVKNIIQNNYLLQNVDLLLAWALGWWSAVLDFWSEIEGDLTI